MYALTLPSHFADGFEHNPSAGAHSAKQGTANAFAPSRIGRYPVHLQRFPSKASSISSLVAVGLFFNSAYKDMTIPGVQNPHWLPCEVATASCTGWGFVALPRPLHNSLIMPHKILTFNGNYMFEVHRHQESQACIHRMMGDLLIPVREARDHHSTRSTAACRTRLHTQDSGFTLCTPELCTGKPNSTQIRD